MFRSGDGFDGRDGGAFGDIPGGLGLGLAGEFHHVAVAAGEEEAAEFENWVGTAGGFDLAGDGFEGTGFREEAGAPAGKGGDLRAVVKAARSAAAVVVSEVGASAAAFATVITGAAGTGAAVVTRAAWAGTAVTGRTSGSTGAGATVVRTGATGRSVRAGAAGAILTGTAKTSGAAWAGGTGAAVILPGAARAVRTGATGRAATVLSEISTSSGAIAPGAAASAAGRAVALSLSAAARFAFMVRGPAPDDFAGRGFALLQVPDPIRGEVEVLQLGEIDGFWIGHVRRSKIRVVGGRGSGQGDRGHPLRDGGSAPASWRGVGKLRMPQRKSILFHAYLGLSGNSVIRKKGKWILILS